MNIIKNLYKKLCDNIITHLIYLISFIKKFYYICCIEDIHGPNSFLLNEKVLNESLLIKEQINSIIDDNIIKLLILCLLKKFSIIVKNIILNYNKIKNCIKYLIKFIKFLLIYFIEKYFYKLNNIDFIIKVRTSTDAFNFFIDLNKLKKIFIKPKKQDYPFARLFCYYSSMLDFIIIISAFYFLLLTVLTKYEKYLHVRMIFEHTGVSLLM